MGPEIPDVRGAEISGVEIDDIIEKKIIEFDSSSEKGVPSNAISPEKPIASKKELDVPPGYMLVEKDKNIPLPRGTPLTNILNIDLSPKDIGKALQFLEFCKVFGEVLDMKEGEAKAILEELVCKEKLHRGESILTTRFQCRVLTVILQNSGNRFPSLSITEEKNSWFKALVNLVSRSDDLVVKELQLGCLKEGIDKYYGLGLSKKLCLLNFLCDEALGTKKLRTFIEDQNLKFVEKGKQAKAKVAEATKKEQCLKQKLQDEMTKSIISENGATLSTSEHDAFLSEIRSEVAKAHDEMLEAMSMAPKRNQRSDALRVESVFSNGCGQRLWRLKCYTTEYAFLIQDSKIEEGQEAVDERWFVYGAEKKEEMEKYIASRAARS